MVFETVKSVAALQDLVNRHWHELPADDVAQVLGSDPTRGLSLSEVMDRRERFGSNQLSARPGRSAWVRFLFQFHDPLVYLLLAAVLIKLIMGGWIDAGAILGVVLVNAIIGYVQEARAEEAIEALSRSLTTETTVLRDGEQKRIPSSELVPGDIVALASGDKVPADVRLTQTRDLQIAESALTGESVPVTKEATTRLTRDTSLGDRANMAYASTLVTYGVGRGIVVACGDSTEVGRISELIAAAPSLETPLTRKMKVFGHRLLLAILALAALVAGIGWLRGESLDEIVSAAIGLAVGAIPEGLPAAVTVTLAIGVSRMARRKAIIRRLPAVETLGSTSVICSDKTGTLTQNQMTVRELQIGRDSVVVSGNGYEPVGAFSADPGPLEPRVHPGVSECLLAGVLCNDGAVAQQDGRWEAQGDPTEVALVVSAAKAGLDPAQTRSRYRRLDAIPFESQHQFMATLHEGDVPATAVIYLKGAVEVVVERCRSAVDLRGDSIPLDREAIHAEVGRMASRGLRVLAMARAHVPAGTRRLDTASLPREFVFLGLQGMIDPPRPEAIEAVAACQRAGIRVKMITGDHAGTALAIGKQLGLVAERPGFRPVLTGKDLALLEGETLADAAENVSVFARVSPEQKLALVRSLQARGQVVAMTGDGVNDGPALKQANIGVAMGITGTEVAKEASDMVLTDDNFASIRAAVEEGRNVFDNLTKTITWALPSNLGQGLVILTAALLGETMPILPLQVLWINMTTGGVLGLFLALEPKERDLMDRPPRRLESPLLSGAMLGQVVLVGALILVAAFGLFEWELRRGAGIDAARTVALNTVAVIQTLTLLNCRSLRNSIVSIGVFSNRWLWAGMGGALALQVALTYVPLLNTVFHTAPIGVDEWVRIVGAGLLALAVVEGFKWFQRGRPARHAGSAPSPVR